MSRTPLIDITKLPQHLLDLEAIKAEKAKRDFRSFVKEAWKVVEPGTPYHHGWHIDAIADHLAAVDAGEIRNLIINMPPRHMKSLMVSVFWPAWTWLRWPECRWMFTSYALSLAIDHSRRCRQVIESDWYQKHYGHIYQLKDDQNAKGKYENTKLGYRLSGSVDSGVTGSGGDIIVVDDPHNAKDAHSDQIREAAVRWWDESMSSRLNDPKTGRKVIVMQRLHEKDLTGHLLAQGGYEHLVLPAEYENKKVFTSIGWSDPREEEGDLLWPSHIGPTEIETLKRTLGSFGYVGQYQQRPTPIGGGIFKKDHFRYFDIEQLPGTDQIYKLKTPEGEKRWLSTQCSRFAVVDLAATTRQTGDYTVVTTVGITPHREMLILDILRGRFEGPDQHRLIQSAWDKWSPGFVAIERSGYQLAFIQSMVRQGFPVRELRPDRDKVARSLTASIRYENGTVYHRQTAEWLFDLEYEMLTFPFGEHDDMVDTLSYAAYFVLLSGEPNVRALN